MIFLVQYHAFAKKNILSEFIQYEYVAASFSSQMLGWVSFSFLCQWQVTDEFLVDLY